MYAICISNSTFSTFQSKQFPTIRSPLNSSSSHYPYSFFTTPSYSSLLLSPPSLSFYASPPYTHLSFPPFPLPSPLISFSISFPPPTSLSFHFVRFISLFNHFASSPTKNSLIIKPTLIFFRAEGAQKVVHYFI